MSKIIIDKQILLDRIAELEKISKANNTETASVYDVDVESFIAEELQSLIQQGEESNETWDEILNEFAKFGKGKLGDWLKNNFKIPERK